MNRFIPSIALLLFTCSVCIAQPDLRVVKSSEYGPNFKGLIGEGIASFACTMKWPAEIDWDSSLPERSIAPEIPRKIMRMNLEVVNVGRSAWRAGNVFLRPDRYKWLAMGPAVVGLLGVTIYDTNGNVVRERVIEWTPSWDVRPALPNLPESSSVWDAAISPGRAAVGEEGPIQYLTGSLIDITAIPDGDYILEVNIDPTNDYGIFDAAKAVRTPIALAYMEVIPTAEVISETAEQPGGQAGSKPSNPTPNASIAPPPAPPGLMYPTHAFVMGNILQTNFLVPVPTILLNSNGVTFVMPPGQGSDTNSNADANGK